jgi:hypothetical protein
MEGSNDGCVTVTGIPTYSQPIRVSKTTLSARGERQC